MPDPPPAAPPPPAAREPEKLLLPAAAVRYLVQLALRTELGGAWWQGFATAYGEPPWLLERRWTLRAPDAHLVRTPAEGEEPA